MTAYLFVGPTLRRDDIAAAGDFCCLPPAAQGDIWRVARLRPRAIGLIDGYFSGAPSVWHKEILWALSQGIMVFGAASMGALRAAELHGFGMRGVGHIFEAYRDGTIEDDDEVAVVHGPAETGYVAASEPMVNIRATLARAEADGIVGPEARRAIEERAKSLFYPRRLWPAILDGADGLDAEIEALRAWLPQGCVDQKRADALSMLAAMREALAGSEPAHPSFAFAWTYLWDEMVTRPDPAAAIATEMPARILDELRLQAGDIYTKMKARALLRHIAGIDAERRRLAPPGDEARAVLRRLRAALGLFSRVELDAWLARNHLDGAALERLIEDEARAEGLAVAAGAALERHLLDELRLAGYYERLAERAGRKDRALAQIDAGGSAPNVTAVRLWFFERRLGRAMPNDVDEFSRELGFSKLPDFDRALRREWLYLQLEGDDPGT